MNLVPLRFVALASDLPPVALLERLRGVIGDGPPALFAGTVAADGFVITRMNEFRSTVMPLLRGGIAARPDGGAGVLVRLRPSWIVVVFMGIWLAFLTAVAAIVVAAHIRDGGRLALLLAPAGLGACSWYVMAAVFDADARWAVEHLVASLPELRPAEHSVNSGTSSPGSASMVRKRR